MNNHPLPHDHRVRRWTILAFISMAPAGWLSAALNIEIVNDSGKADSAVFVMMQGDKVGGTPISVTGLPVTDKTSAVTSAAVGALAPAGYNVTSRFSGRSLPVYSASIGSIASGVFFVSYDQPLTISNTNPSPVTSNLRFDQCELTFDPTIESVANLTSIDAFAVPMQFELFNGTAPSLNRVGSRSYYLSSTSLIQRFQQLGLSAAFRGIAPPPATQPVNWQISDGMGAFARVLGPNQITAASPTGSPAPYPGFGGYLESLLSQQFGVSGNANASSYTYNATVVSDGNGGYQVQLTGTTHPAPPPPVPDDANMTVNLPSATAPGAQDNVNYDFFIYGAPLNGQSMSVTGLTTQQINENSNIVYGAIARDVLSALNFGYVNGRYGSKSQDWYAFAPTAYPFGGARTANDGFYNPWAAVLYNASEAYGFAFSDRTGPSPAIKLENNQTLRITILPDERLDSPQATVTATTDNSISLAWPAVAGATGYQVTVSKPEPVRNLTVPAAVGTVVYTIPDLSPGVPYSYSVSATGTANGNPVISPGIPLQATTTGTLQPVIGGDLAFGTSFSYLPLAAYEAGAKVTINGVDLLYRASGDKQGQWLTPSTANPPDANAMINGTSGLNQYVLTVRNDVQGTIFQNIVSVNLDGTSLSYTFDGGVLNGNDVANPLTGGPGPYNNGIPLIAGIPFVPLPTKKEWPVVLPSSAYTTWIGTFTAITNPADRDKSANPDGDAMNNVTEFALDSDPASGVSSGRSGGGIANVGGTPYLTLTFPTRAGTVPLPGDPSGGEFVLNQAAEGITYKVQASSGLETFALDVAEVTGTEAAAIQSLFPALDTGWTYRTFRCPDASSGAAACFMRVVVVAD